MRFLTALLAVATLAIAVITGTTGCTESIQRQADKVNFYSETEENQMGADAYAEVLKSEKRSTDAEANAMIERVGRRLAAVVPGGEKFAWEFTLLESDQINAFCLPGGKVAFYTGILAYCQNEAAVAAVMGHEIGHAVARHGGKRMTQGVILNGATVFAGELLKAKGYSESNTNLMLALGGGLANVGVVLPFSRGHELEADAMGLGYMAKAGYDPEEAVAFWTRFAALGSSGPAFLSTHPQSADRAAELGKRMPKAKEQYAAAAQKYGLGAKVPAKYLTAPKPADASTK
jgi:metalloendopeptidase OMA1, mitochondrial